MNPSTQEDTHAAALRAVGLHAYGYDGLRLGRVEGVLVDRQLGDVQWLQLRVPGYSGAFIGVPLDGFSVRAHRLHLHLDSRQLHAAPRVPTGGVLTARLEAALCDFFGVSTRGGRLDSRERRATSALLIAPGIWEPEPRHDGPAPDTHEGRQAPALTLA